MELSEESKKSLSFGFSKKRETVKLKKSVVNDQDEKEENGKDFVLSLEGKELKSTKSGREKRKKEFVIPLIQQNKWRTQGPDKDKEDISSNNESSSNLELLAAEEILKDSARLNDNWEKNHKAEETSRSIPLPLLMQNKIPEGYETDEKLDVDLRPEEPTDANYDEIPIEHFGLAMLRGMGWSENRGVGRNGKVIAPVEAQIRPKGLGLGADRSNDKQAKSKGKQEVKDSSEQQLELKKGTYCIVTSGANKDSYAAVEGVDEDNSRVMVKLALTGKVCNLMQCNISLISKKEYDQFSKYLNKQKADKYKKDEEERLAKSEQSNGYFEKHKSHKSKRQNSEDDENSDSHSKEHKRHKKDNNEHHSSSHKHSSSKHKKKHKSHKDERSRSKDSEKQSPSPSYSEDEGESPVLSINQRPWVQPDLRVRVVDESCQKFYKEKVIIVDVPSPGVCVCKSNDGKVIDGISQSSLETVIPRDDNSFVLIVSGAHRGNVGQIMKRDKTKCLCLVQLLSDRDTVLKLGYDEVCEYIGNVHAREDY